MACGCPTQLPALVSLAAVEVLATALHHTVRYALAAALACLGVVLILYLRHRWRLLHGPGRPHDREGER